MSRRDKYIMFSQTMKGRDGCKYISNVKYSIQRETESAFLLAGKNGKLNSFPKTKLTGKFATGSIIRE